MPELIELDQDQVAEEFFRRGWTDGLPVVPPTERAVDAMIATVDLERDDIVGGIARRNRWVSVEQAAVNAVMAGCKPEYFPVVVAALAASLDPAFNAHAAWTSTGGAATCVVVSGPLAEEIGMNSGHNALGAGNRANATIGRAVRLVARNVFGAAVGNMDASSLGNPGKYTLCFAESEPAAPWSPLRVQQGYDVSDTTVTVMATESPRQVANHLSEVPEQVLRTIVSAMKVAANFPVGKGGQAMVVLGPEHALALTQAGWTQQQVREFLARESRLTPEELVANGVPIEVNSQHDMTPGPDGKLPAMNSADDVYLVTAGGAGPGWSAYIPSFAPIHHVRAVTRKVRTLGEAMPDCGPDACEIDLSKFASTTTSV
ncbi:hypothetical protein [Nocardioides houyundeii]|uniref:hypothetical protein n=1 Tax=Nocardioides houyundeii TaxID=2045452 RepID=UPI000C7713DB|nr:hypothetical protein [Nocardioides houyundeii]